MSIDYKGARWPRFSFKTLKTTLRNACSAGLRDTATVRNAVKDYIPSPGRLGTDIVALFEGIGLQEGEEILESRGTPSRTSFGDAAVS